MRRSVPLLLTCLLGLVTAVALLAAGRLLTTPASEAALESAPGDAAAAANTALVRRFYAAVNQTLETGDPALLDRLVAAEFAEHAALPGLPPTRAGLARYLVGLGATFPTMRLSVVDLLAQGDEVMARVRVDGAAGGDFLGLPVPGELAAWGPLDVFRVERGAIVEHWPSRDGAVLLRPLTRTPLALPTAAGVSLQIERLTYAPRATTTARRNLQLRVVALEIGTLDVRIDGEAKLDRAPASEALGPREAVPVTGEVRLSPGDLLILPVAVAFRIINPGRAPAVSIEVAVALPQPLTPMTDRIGSPSTGGTVTAHLLASSLVPEPVEPVVVEIGRAILAPGTSFPAPATPGLNLFHVEAGIVDPEAGDGIAWTSGGSGGAGDGAGAPEFGAGKGILLQSDTFAALRNAGETPATLLVVTVRPAGEPETST